MSSYVLKMRHVWKWIFCYQIWIIISIQYSLYLDVDTENNNNIYNNYLRRERRSERTTVTRNGNRHRVNYLALALLDNIMDEEKFIEDEDLSTVSIEDVPYIDYMTVHRFTFHSEENQAISSSSSFSAPFLNDIHNAPLKGISLPFKEVKKIIHFDALGEDYQSRRKSNLISSSCWHQYWLTDMGLFHVVCNMKNQKCDFFPFLDEKMNGLSKILTSKETTMNTGDTAQLVLLPWEVVENGSNLLVFSTGGIFECSYKSLTCTLLQTFFSSISVDKNGKNSPGYDQKTIDETSPSLTNVTSVIIYPSFEEGDEEEDNFQVDSREKHKVSTSKSRAIYHVGTSNGIYSFDYSSLHLEAIDHNIVPGPIQNLAWEREERNGEDVKVLVASRFDRIFFGYETCEDLGKDFKEDKERNILKGCNQKGESFEWEHEWIGYMFDDMILNTVPSYAYHKVQVSEESKYRYKNKQNFQHGQEKTIYDGLSYHMNKYGINTRTKYNGLIDRLNGMAGLPYANFTTIAQYDGQTSHNDKYKNDIGEMEYNDKNTDGFDLTLNGYNNLLNGYLVSPNEAHFWLGTKDGAVVLVEDISATSYLQNEEERQSSRSRVRKDPSFYFMNGPRWQQGNEVRSISYGKGMKGNALMLKHNKRDRKQNKRENKVRKGEDTDDIKERLLLIVERSQNLIWLIDDKGISLINALFWTLEDKALYLQASLIPRHQHHGLVQEYTLQEIGNPASGHPTGEPGDNDGLWTSAYVSSAALQYAVTQDSLALNHMLEGFSALEFLQTCTGIPGYPARSFANESDLTISSTTSKNTISDRMIPCPNNKGWYYVGDESSDELCGHFMAFTVLHSVLLQSEESDTVKSMNWKKEIERVKAAGDKLLGNLLRNNYQLVGETGNTTTWGHWEPEYLNDNWRGAQERNLNSLEILSWLMAMKKIAEQHNDIQLVEKYSKSLHYLIYENNYLENILNGKNTAITDINHSDDELGFFAYYTLLFSEDFFHKKRGPKPTTDYEKNVHQDEKKNEQLDMENYMIENLDISLTQWFNSIAGQKSCLYYSIYSKWLSTQRSDTYDQIQEYIKIARKDLQTFQISWVNWPVILEERNDVLYNPDCPMKTVTEDEDDGSKKILNQPDEQMGKMIRVWNTKGQRSKTSMTMQNIGSKGGYSYAIQNLPVRETSAQRWNKNPYDMVAGNMQTEHDPTEFLFVYWLMRYHGLIH